MTYADYIDSTPWDFAAAMLPLWIALGGIAIGFLARLVFEK